MKQKITVFGSYVADLMGRAPHLPCPGETVKGSMFRMGAGGKGFNQCVAAWKAGGEAVIVTKLARDAFGQPALELMRELGMDESGLIFTDSAASGIALILVDEATGQNEILVVPGACGTITAADVECAVPRIQDSGYLLTQLETNLDALSLAVETAREAGVRVILNPAPAQPVEDALLAKLELITPNEVEAEALTGVHIESEADALRAAEVFLHKGVKQVVITLGGRGAFVCDGKQHRLLPPFHVEAVDATGAGDAFNGALVAALAEGMDLWTAAEFANAAAALSVTKLGTAGAMAERTAIDAFLAERRAAQ